MATETRRPIVHLLTDIINEVTGLMQAELRLVRVELNEKIGKLASGGVMIGAGAVCLIAGLTIAFLALTEWLVVVGLPREAALTLVAMAALAIGALIAARGVQSIKSTELVPERSLHRVRQDLNIIKEHVS
ncbi:MAG: phage holin family protein [Hyphomicrobiales bacterium]